MLSAGLLVASLLYWGSNSDAPAKTMISPAKIIGVRQRKCQHSKPPTDFFRTFHHKTYSYSSPNNYEYPCSLLNRSVTTDQLPQGRGGRNQCLAQDKRDHSRLNFAWYQVQHLTLNVFKKTQLDFIRTSRHHCTAVWLLLQAHRTIPLNNPCACSSSTMCTEEGDRKGKISTPFSVQSALKIQQKNSFNY